MEETEGRKGRKESAIILYQLKILKCNYKNKKQKRLLLPKFTAEIIQEQQKLDLVYMSEGGGQAVLWLISQGQIKTINLL